MWRTRTPSPHSWVQPLETTDRGVTASAVSEWAARMGLALLRPTDVGGFRHRREWLDARTAAVRINFVYALMAGELDDGAGPFDALGLARRYGHGRDTREVASFYTRLWLGFDRDESADWCEAIAARYGAAIDNDNARAIAAAVLASPQGQVA